MNAHIPGENEEMLISKLKAGEEWAIDAIYELYANRLFGQIIKFARSVEPAQGILQDVFLKRRFKENAAKYGLKLASYG